MESECRHHPVGSGGGVWKDSIGCAKKCLLTFSLSFDIFIVKTEITKKVLLLNKFWHISYMNKKLLSFAKGSFVCRIVVPQIICPARTLLFRCGGSEKMPRRLIGWPAFDSAVLRAQFLSPTIAPRKDLLSPNWCRSNARSKRPFVTIIFCDHILRSYSAILLLRSSF